MSILPAGLSLPVPPLVGPQTTTTALVGQPTAATAPTEALGAQAGGGGFGSTLSNALDSLQATQANADNLATQAATGTLTNVADYMVAAEQANIQTQLTAAVKNNALQAFQQIMGMQL